MGWSRRHTLAYSLRCIIIFLYLCLYKSDFGHILLTLVTLVLENTSSASGFIDSFMSGIFDAKSVRFCKFCWKFRTRVGQKHMSCTRWSIWSRYKMVRLFFSLMQWDSSFKWNSPHLLYFSNKRRTIFKHLTNENGNNHKSIQRV